MNPDDDSRDLCGPLLFRIFSLDTMKVTFFAQALLLGLPCATIAFQTPLKREFEPTVSPRRTVLRVQQNDNENVPFSLKDQQKDTGTTNTAEDNDEAPNATAVETKADNIDNETKDAPKVTDVDKAVDIEGREDEVKAFLDAAGAAAGAAATSAARGLFSLLRQAAAESLTTSLPNDERKALMNKLSNQKTRGDSDGDDESMSQSNSVQENVVAANISEAGRSGKDITELDQQSLLEQATMATQERTESDIASQNFENRHYTAKEYSALSEEDKEALRELRKKQGTPSEPDVPSSPTSTAHPILGPVVLDLGHKRIHVLSAGKLGSIPIWNKQRIYRHDRVKGMAADKWKKSMSLGLPGVICLHEDDSGQLCVIDGQHRIGMMTMLREKQREKLREINSEKDSETNTIDFDNIIVEVYPVAGRVKITPKSCF